MREKKKQGWRERCRGRREVQAERVGITPHLPPRAALPWGFWPLCTGSEGAGFKVPDMDTGATQKGTLGQGGRAMPGARDPSLFLLSLPPAFNGR